MIIGLIVVLVFSRCSGPKVIAFTGGNPDFGSYYTYKIQHPSTPEEQEQGEIQFLSRIEEAISGQMNSRGYTQAGLSDMVVSYNLILDNKVDYRSNSSSRYGYPYSYANTYSYWSDPYWLDRDEYTQGTLLVELRESLGNRLIWQASLDLRYRQKSSKKKKKNDPVEEAFGIIFSEYHYIAGKSQPQNPENQ